MGMTPEKKVKDWVKKRFLQKYPKAYWYMPVPMGFGKRGVPDVLLCIEGIFVGVECKADGGEVTVLQKKNLDAIIAAGGIAAVIRRKDDPRLEVLFNVIDKRIAERRAIY